MRNDLIPEGTRIISRHQFKNLTEEEISLPEGLEEIHAHAFRNSRLRRIRIPSTVKSIGFGAFSSGDLLEEVILPEDICFIGCRAFSECEALRMVRNYPDHGVGEQAFYEYRLLQHCCPWCGAALNKEDRCSQCCNNPYDWIGSLRLYKGLFWWDGKQLITVKVHCNQLGTPAYSNRFFEKQSFIGNHQYEWNRMKEAGDLRIKKMERPDDLPYGRVEIKDFSAAVCLHPRMNRPEIIKKILNEFGLCKKMQSLDRIMIINGCS